MEQSHLDNIVIALLFASDEALSAKRISAILDDVETSDIRASIDRLTHRFSGDMPSILLESVAGGWQLSTNPDYADYVAKLYSGRRKQRLSKAALETVAIIAYKQPVTRADIETVRGVSCGGVVTTLMERTLIKIVGKAKVLGAPFLYGTTHEFLEYLGINSLKDLPSIEELEALLEHEESTQVPEDRELSAAGEPGGSTNEETAAVEEGEGNVDEEDDHEWEAYSASKDQPQGEDDADPVQLDG
jgi:segregation and condensation protein B